MKRLIAALLLWSGLAQAQDMTPEVCKASVEPLEASLDLWVPSPTVDAVGRCTSFDVVFFEDETMTLRADRMNWQIGEATRWIEQQLPPTRIEIEMEGIRTEAQTGDVVLDYLLRVQSKSKPVFGGLVLDWDSASNVLTLDDAYLDFGSLGRLEVSAVASGVDLSSQAAIGISGLTAVLDRLKINLETTGFFEAYVLVPLGSIVLQGEADPARAAAIIKSHRIADVRALESDVIDVAGKDALVKLIEEMPNPNGVLNVDLRSENGLPFLLLGSALLNDPLSRQGDPFAAFSGSTIALDWTTLSKP